MPSDIRTEHSLWHVLDTSNLTGSKLTRFRVCLSSVQYTHQNKWFGCGNVQNEKTVIQGWPLLLLLWPLWWCDKGLVPFAILNLSQSSLAWKKIRGPIRLQGCETLSFHWIRETVQIEVIIVRQNVHVNISEQVTICDCTRPSFEGSVNMDLQEDVGEDNNLRKSLV